MDFSAFERDALKERLKLLMQNPVQATILEHSVEISEVIDYNSFTDNKKQFISYAKIPLNRSVTVSLGF